MLKPLYFFNDGKKNVGDLLGPKLIQAMYPSISFEVDGTNTRHGKLISVGSVLQHALRPGDVVWGSGLIAEEYSVDVSDNQVLALRGPLTAAKCTGLKEQVPYGDPGILAPVIHNSPEGKDRRYLGLLPHYIDVLDFPMYFDNSNGCLTLDITNTLEQIVDELSECHTVITSTLHGLILAEAYQVPNIILEPSPMNKITGGFHKYADYFAGTYRPGQGYGYVEQMTLTQMMSVQNRLVHALDSYITNV